MVSKFGERLRGLRKVRGFTQNQLSKELNIDRVTVTQYESGRREPQLEKIIMLANYFDVTTDYLLGNDRETNIESNPLLTLSKETTKGFTIEGEIYRQGGEKMFGQKHHVVPLSKFDIGMIQVRGGSILLVQDRRYAIGDTVLVVEDVITHDSMKLGKKYKIVQLKEQPKQCVELKLSEVEHTTVFN